MVLHYRIRAQIAPADGHTATSAAGVQVFQGYGRFLSPDQVEVDGRVLRFKKVVLAVGGRAAVPSSIRGLGAAPYVTNATLFNLTELPLRMVIIGAG